MQMSDSRLIPAPRDVVWAALNDPEILKRAIPGCESLDMASPTEMTATIKLKIGPIKATFTGKVTLSDLDPPNGYRISGEGSGGVAGFAKGGASVKLTDEDEGTRLAYEVDAQIGGKLAQLGARLIDSTATKLAGEFFDNFAAALSPPAEEGAEAATPEEKKSWYKGLFSKGATTAVLALALGLGAGFAYDCCAISDAGVICKAAPQA